jgi:hypothetical protein
VQASEQLLEVLHIQLNIQQVTANFCGFGLEAVDSFHSNHFQVLKSLTGHSLTFVSCLIHLILIVPTFQVLELVLVASLNISAQIN